MKYKKAVLFDYDGVIVDTMEEMYMAWSTAINFYKKIKIAKNIFYLLEGRPARKMAEHLFAKYNIELELIEEVIKKKDEYYFKTARSRINKKVIEIIDFLKNKDILIGIVSGAPLSRIRKVLKSSVLKKIDAIVTAEDTINGKPHPEPYLKAIKKLKVKKHHSIVVENAPLGIESAIKAGLFCIAVESTLHRRHLENAHKVLKDFDEMFVYFKSKF